MIQWVDLFGEEKKGIEQKRREKLTKHNDMKGTDMAPAVKLIRLVQFHALYKVMADLTAMYS